MLLPRLLLTPFGSAWHTNGATRVFRKRCAQFLDGEWEKLYRDSSAFAVGLDKPAGAAAGTTPPMSEDMARDRVKDEVIKLVQRGRVRQAMQRLSSLGTAKYGEETAIKLKSMQFLAAAPDHIYALDAEELDTLRSWRPTIVRRAAAAARRRGGGGAWSRRGEAGNGPLGIVPLCHCALLGCEDEAGFPAPRCVTLVYTSVTHRGDRLLIPAHFSEPLQSY
jgi:hypothetical protein